MFQVMHIWLLKQLHQQISIVFTSSSVLFFEKKNKKTPMGKDNEGSEKAVPNPPFH